MGVKMLECQVQRGVTLEVNAMVKVARNGFNQPTRQTPVFLSHLRHLSHRSPWVDYQSFPQVSGADVLGDDDIEGRAGRPGSNAGVLVRRSPANQAGLAVQFGQPPATEVLAVAWRCAFEKAKRRASRVLPRRMLAITPLWGAMGRASRASTRGMTAR
jgi:hypothetical protein